MEDRWLSVTDVCDYLGVSRDTIYKWIDQLQMPAARAGRRWKFKKDDIDCWMKSGGADGTLVHSPSQGGKEVHHGV